MSPSGWIKEGRARSDWLFGGRRWSSSREEAIVGHLTKGLIRRLKVKRPLPPLPPTCQHSKVGQHSTRTTEAASKVFSPSPSAVSLTLLNAHAFINDSGLITASISNIRCVVVNELTAVNIWCTEWTESCTFDFPELNTCCCFFLQPSQPCLLSPSQWLLNEAPLRGITRTRAQRGP